MAQHEPELFEVRQVLPGPEGDYSAETAPHIFYVRCLGCGGWTVAKDRDAAAQALRLHTEGLPLGSTAPAAGRALPDAFGGILVMTITDPESHDELAEHLAELVRTTGASAGVVLAEGETLELSTHDDVVRALAVALGDGDTSDPTAWEAWRSVSERALPRLARQGWSLVPIGPEHVVVRHLDGDDSGRT